MRIVHVSARWGPSGGTEVYLSRLLAAQQAHGLEVAVVASAVSAPPPAPLRIVAGLDAAETDPQRVRSDFEAAVAELSPDVVHFHNVTNPVVLEQAPGLVASVSSIHDHVPFCPGLNKEYADGGLCDRPMGRHCLERYRGDGCLCLRTPDLVGVLRRVLETQRLLSAHGQLAGVAVASRYMRNELERVGFGPESVHVVPLFATPSKTVPPSANADRVLMVGRMVHPDKGVEPLLEALSQVRASVHARVVGAGPARARFEASSAARDLGDAVAFVGQGSPEAVHEDMRRARLVVLPSMWNEPFGIVGLEAMACGRPVVAFDVGGVREWLVHEETGLLVARGDTAALAAAIERLLADASLADRLGRAARERVVQSFAPDAHLARLTDLYARALRVAGQKVSALRFVASTLDDLGVLEGLAEAADHLHALTERASQSDAAARVAATERDAAREEHARASMAHDRLLAHHRQWAARTAAGLRARAAALPVWNRGQRGWMIDLAEALEREGS